MYPRDPGAEPYQPTPQAEQRVTHSVHAECTLAMHTISMNREWKYIALGVSKGSCWLCEKFLNLVTPSGRLQFLVSGFNGKLYPGWLCPPLATPLKQTTIEMVVSDALAEIVQRTLNRRCSNLFLLREIDGLLQSSVVAFLEDDISWLNCI